MFLKWKSAEGRRKMKSFRLLTSIARMCKLWWKFPKFLTCCIKSSELMKSCICDQNFFREEIKISQGWALIHQISWKLFRSNSCWTLKCLIRQAVQKSGEAPRCRDIARELRRRVSPHEVVENFRVVKWQLAFTLKISWGEICSSSSSTCAREMFTKPFAVRCDVDSWVNANELNETWSFSELLS